MLDEKDLQAISTLFDTRIASVIRENNEVIFAVMDQKFEANNKKIIHAVGEMLEDNVFPQFEEIHRELRQIKMVIGMQT